MKKRIIIYFAIITLLLTGCGVRTYHYKVPNDELSKAIYEEFGYDIYYENKYIDEFGCTCYWYVVMSDEEDLLYNFVTTVNAVMQENDITEKIKIFYAAEGLPGSTMSIAVLTNYSDRELESPDYETLQYVSILGVEHADEKFDFYNGPSTYLNLPDIRYLEVNQKINDQAKEQGINWYEVWPDLEQMEIFQHPD